MVLLHSRWVFAATCGAALPGFSNPQCSGRRSKSIIGYSVALGRCRLDPSWEDDCPSRLGLI